MLMGAMSMGRNAPAFPGVMGGDRGSSKASDISAEFLLIPEGRKVEQGLFAVDTKLGGWFRAAGRARVKPVTAEELGFE